MSDTTADLLLQELLHVFRTTICTAPGETVRADLFQREAGRRLLPKWGGFGAAAAAWLALEDHRGNPWHGRDDLLQFAFAAADRLLVDHAALGGPGRAGRKPNHFTIYPLAQLYTLAAEQAGAARRARWRELMARNLRRVAETIDRTWPTLGRPGPFAGTGPNHLFGWIAIGLAQAVVLEDDRLARRCEAAMLRHLKIQAPGGYFPEHDGPVVLYHCVSLEGVSEFFRHRPLPVVARALERGVDFYLRAIYPDLTGIETFDERNRGVHATTPVGAFAWTPAGRRLLRLIVERRHAARGAAAAPRANRPATRPQGPRGAEKTPDWKALGGVPWWALGQLFRTFEQTLVAAERGPLTERPLPIERPRSVWNIEDRGLVRKDGPWVSSLSAWCNLAPPGNPYHLERNQAFGLFHETAGRIVGGGNDKRAPFNATVHVVEEGEVHYHPPVAAAVRANVRPRALKGAERCDRLEQDYGSAQVALEIAVESPRAVRLALSAAANMVNHEIALVLQLVERAPFTLRTGSAAGRLKPLKLRTATAEQALESRPLGRVLELPGRWRMQLPSGALLQWPHRPWDPYRPPAYLAQPEAAVALVRLPLNAAPWRLQLRIEALD